MAPPLMTWAANSGSLRPNPLMDYAPLRNRAIAPRDQQRVAPAPPPRDVFHHARRTTTPRRLPKMDESTAGSGTYNKARSDVTSFHEQVRAPPAPLLPASALGMQLPWTAGAERVLLAWQVQATSNNPYDYKWQESFGRSKPAPAALVRPTVAFCDT